jgi:hypothetical protein
MQEIETTKPEGDSALLAPVVGVGREEFLEIVTVEQPPVVYHYEGIHYFPMVGLTVWTSAPVYPDLRSRELLIVKDASTFR